MKIFSQRKQIILVCVVVIGLVCLFLFAPKLFQEHYVFGFSKDISTSTTTTLVDNPVQKVFMPLYIDTPEPLKGIYMTSWIASSESLRGDLVKLIDDTELNTVVIDIKDYTGKIAFPITNPELKAYGSEEIRVKDMKDFVKSLHEKGIYVIGRVAVFQDAYFVKHNADLAVKDKAGTAVWKDRKGISWIDPGSREYWDYIILLARESRAVGFDEVNFDYIRFPSDGNMKDISYPFSSTTPKVEVMRQFFEYIHDKLSLNDGSPAGSTTRLKVSADLFGMVTTASDDMGIGQLLENALPYFDYISPMVYPSHYPATFQGFALPEAHPYDVVHYAMKEGERRAETLASTTGKSVAQLRPWLQDFGLKMTYGAPEVRAQIKATNDVGISSWLLWSASNKYTKSALLEK